MNVLGVGIDLVDVDRFRRSLQRTPSMIERMFTEDERTYALAVNDPAERFAVRFAAKEAVMKAMGVGLGAGAVAGGIAVNGAGVTDQNMYRRRGRRGLLRGAAQLDDADGTYADMEEYALNGSEGGWTVENLRVRRRLPSTSSALDVSMTITGGYRPPPYVDADVLVEDSINRAAPKMADELRERGNREGSELFKRVRGVEAVRRDRKTGRPTRSPAAPTGSPSEDPTSE